jgi:hypothetical protein
MSQLDPRKFGLSLAVALGAGGIISFLNAGPPVESRFLWCAAAALTVIASVRPTCLATPAKFWMALGEFMGRIVNPVVWACIYVICFAPIGMARRLLKRDQLHLSFDKSAGSYWVPRHPAEAPADTLDRQF